MKVSMYLLWILGNSLASLKKGLLLTMMSLIHPTCRALLGGILLVISLHGRSFSQGDADASRQLSVDRSLTKPMGEQKFNSSQNGSQFDYNYATLLGQQQNDEEFIVRVDSIDNNGTRIIVLEFDPGSQAEQKAVFFEHAFPRDLSIVTITGAGRFSSLTTKDEENLEHGRIHVPLPASFSNEGRMVTMRIYPNGTGYDNNNPILRMGGGDPIQVVVDLKVGPYPITESSIITHDIAVPQEIVIYSITGQKIANTVISAENGKLVSELNLASGFYVLCLPDPKSKPLRIRIP